MAEKPVQLKLFDKAFACTVCGCDTFHKKRWELKALGSSFLQNKDTPISMICTQCGYVHWFMPDMGQYQKAPEEPENGGDS